MRKCVIFALFALGTSWLIPQKMSAQRAGSGFAHFSHAMPAHGSPAAGLTSRADFVTLHRLYWGNPYGDPLSSFGIFSDALGDSAPYGNPAVAAPNFFLMPSLPSAGMVEDQPQPAAQALMIELRGDRYVRVTNGGETVENASTSAATRPQISVRSTKNQPESDREAAISIQVPQSSNSIRQVESRNLEPAVLIFRDGHRESVRDYAITGGMLYARGDFYTDGYWTKSIDLARVNLSDTISSNAERGVNFVLPSAPNEVVTRP